MKLLILVVDDEPDVELLFRQQFDFGALRSEIDIRVQRAA
jgi:hypothetical protein